MPDLLQIFWRPTHPFTQKDDRPQDPETSPQFLGCCLVGQIFIIADQAKDAGANG